MIETVQHSRDYGVIVARNTEPLKYSTYLLTKDEYTDFRLTFSAKLVESEMHSGVAFWGEVFPEADGKVQNPKTDRSEYTYKGHLVMFPSGWGMYDLFGRNGLVESLYLDRHKRLWIGTFRAGILRVDDITSERPVAANLTTAVEPDLFETTDRARLRDLTDAVDRVRDRYGFDAVTPASLLNFRRKKRKED